MTQPEWQPGWWPVPATHGPPAPPGPGPVTPGPLVNARSTRGWSYYGAWSECHRKWAYDNLYPPPTAMATSARGASIGTLVHALLARSYRLMMGQAQPTVGEVVAAVRGYLSDDDVALAVTRASEHGVRWAPESWEPLHVEEEFACGFLPVYAGGDVGGAGGRRRLVRVDVVSAGTPGSCLYTARIDLVARDRSDGRVWGVDHKTEYRLSLDSGSDYSLSGQMHGLTRLGRFHWGPEFGGVKLNFLQTHAGSKFHRATAAPAPALVERFPLTVVEIASEIALWSSDVPTGVAPTSAQDFRPASSPIICVSKWGGCPYRTHCRFGQLAEGILLPR